MPHHIMVLPHYMGRSREIDIKHTNSDENQKVISRQDSFSSQSPLEDIPLLLPLEADGVAPSNVGSKLNGLHMNHNLLDDQPNGDSGSFSSTFQKPEVEASVADIQINGFVNDLDSVDLQSEMDSNAVAECGMKTSEEWWETPKEGNHAVAGKDCIGPRTACRVQVCYTSWSL